MILLEIVWIGKLDTRLAVSSDDENNRAPIRNYPASQIIVCNPRPAARHNKIGIVEQENGTVKAIMAKRDDEKSSATAETVLSRAAFLSNMFSGNRILSAFELVSRGYCPSILGIPQTVVTAEILHVHCEQVANRTIQSHMSSRAPQVLRCDMFNPGDPVWVYTTLRNEMKR